MKIKLNKNLIFTLMVWCSALVQGFAQVGKVSLKVGDRAPEIIGYKWVAGKKVEQFVPGRTYVVEFTATWCTPCAKMIPHLTRLAKDYAGKVEVVSIFVMELNTEPKGTANPKYVRNVELYVQKRRGEIGYHMAVDDPERTMEQRWLASAGRQGVPQSFVVDGTGRIAYIGSNPEELEKVVAVVSGPDYQLSDFVARAQGDRVETSYDPYKPLLVDGNGGRADDFAFRSVLVEAKGDYSSGFPSHISSNRHGKKGNWYEVLMAYQGRFQITNAGLSYLYKLAYSDTISGEPYMRNPVTDQYPDTVAYPAMRSSYGKYWRYPVLQLRDTALFEKKGYGAVHEYHYSLTLPKERASAAELQLAMREDLRRYFGHQVRVERRRMPCWVLRKDSASTVWTSQRQATGQESNNEVRDLIWLLATSFGAGFVPPDRAIVAPFVDETGIRGRFEFGMSEEELAGFRADIKGAQEYLRTLGLTLTPELREMNVIVVGDPSKAVK